MKLCPFCGSDDAGYSYGSHPDGRELSFIACGNCGASGPVRTYSNEWDDDESEAAWNKRYGTPAEPQHLDQCGAELALLCVVVRRSEVEHLMPHIAHISAAIRREHDGTNKVPGVGEGVDHQEVLALPAGRKGADDTHKDLPPLVWSEFSRPILPPGFDEIACVHGSVIMERDWAPWHGHLALVDLNPQQLFPVRFTAKVTRVHAMDAEVDTEQVPA